MFLGMDFVATMGNAIGDVSELEQLPWVSPMRCQIEGTTINVASRSTNVGSFMSMATSNRGNFKLAARASVNQPQHGHRRCREGRSIQKSSMS